MKTTMKIFAAIMITLAFSANAFSQATNTSAADIPAAATVATEISVSGSAGGLNFGLVTPGIDKTITNTGAILPATAVSAGDRLGDFTVTKGAFTQLSLAFTLPTDLVGTGTNVLDIDFLTTSARLSEGSNNLTFDPNTTFNVTSAAATLFAYNAPSFSVFIGGLVKPTTAQASGAYSGTITLRATYN
jgi:hypothetical protein